ncbi:MAG: cobalamin-dependent protein [Ignavibacteriaceae bacterium]
MKETYITTRDAAGLLGVTETTIKRWTDSNRLKCVKTLGGHRKYLMKDIEEFARENKIIISGVTPPVKKEYMERLGYAVFTKNQDQIIEIILNESLKGNRDSLFDLFMYLTKNRVKFSNLVDEIVHPVMEIIGDMWHKNQIDIEQEHLASDTIKNSLSRLVVHLPHQRKNNTKVICACSEGEYHDMGLQALAYDLELKGYALHFLGANTPFRSIVKAVTNEKPKYVLVSATYPSISQEEFIQGIKKTAKAAKANDAKLLVGGRFAQNFDKGTLGCDAIMNSIKEINSYLNK